MFKTAKDMAMALNSASLGRLVTIKPSALSKRSKTAALIFCQSLGPLSPEFSPEIKTGSTCAITASSGMLKNQSLTSDSFSTAIGSLSERMVPPESSK